MRRSILPIVVLFLFGVVAAPATAAEDLQSLVDAASPGDVLTLPSGTYEGNVVISKPLEIHGDGWPVIDGGGEGNVITVEAPDVVITGLVIANTGTSLEQENAGLSVNAPRVTIVGNRFESVLFGVFLRRAVDSYVANNIIGAMDVEVARRGDGIRLWESSRTVIEGNVVDGGRDSVLWFSDDLTLRGNRVTNGRYGIHFMYSDGALVEGNHLSSNSVGGFLMYSRDLVLKDNLISDNHGPSGYGIGLKDMDGVEATGNYLIGNRVGVYLDNSPATPGLKHHFTDNVFAYNEIGTLFLPSVKGNVLVGNAFVENGEQVGVQGKGEFHGSNVWTVGDSGNYWSDFAGYDADDDGVGDIPYQLADLFSSLTDKHPELHFFDTTPASKAIDLAGRMFPSFRPRPKVTDSAPLVEMPRIPVPVTTDQSASTLETAAASTGMVAMAGALWLIARAPLRRRTR